MFETKHYSQEECLVTVRLSDPCDLDLERFPADGLDVPVIPLLDSKIAVSVENGQFLDMNEWHLCETTHCRAGWAIVHGGARARSLERRFGSNAAGALIYHASTGRVPDFFCGNEEALADIRRRAKAEQAAIRG